MNLLIDESLSARVATLLAAAGYDAIHVAELSLLGAPDTDVMAAARRDHRCVISVDTDFGELLAVGNHAEPSVVLLRRAPHRPQDQAQLLITALPLLKDDLDMAPSSSSPPTEPASATSPSDQPEHTPILSGLPGANTAAPERLRRRADHPDGGSVQALRNGWLARRRPPDRAIAGYLLPST